MDQHGVAWSDEKNQLLKANRGFGFEQVMEALADGRLLEDLPNPSVNFPNQRILIVEIHAYAYIVPYIYNNGKMFLKTLYASRKATKKYLRGHEQ